MCYPRRRPFIFRAPNCCVPRDYFLYRVSWVCFPVRFSSPERDANFIVFPQYLAQRAPDLNSLLTKFWVMMRMYGVTGLTATGAKHRLERTFSASRVLWPQEPCHSSQKLHRKLSLTYCHSKFIWNLWRLILETQVKWSFWISPYTRGRACATIS